MSTKEIRPWTASPELTRHIQELAFTQTLSETAQAYVTAPSDKAPMGSHPSPRANAEFTCHVRTLRAGGRP